MIWIHSGMSGWNLVEQEQPIAGGFPLVQIIARMARTMRSTEGSVVARPSTRG